MRWSRCHWRRWIASLRPQNRLPLFDRRRRSPRGWRRYARRFPCRRGNRCALLALLLRRRIGRRRCLLRGPRLCPIRRASPALHRRRRLRTGRQGRRSRSRPSPRIHWPRLAGSDCSRRARIRLRRALIGWLGRLLVLCNLLARLFRTEVLRVSEVPARAKHNRPNHDPRDQPNAPTLSLNRRRRPAHRYGIGRWPAHRRSRHTHRRGWRRHRQRCGDRPLRSRRRHRRRSNRRPQRLTARIAELQPRRRRRSTLRALCSTRCHWRRWRGRSCHRHYSNRPAAPRTELQPRRHARPALRALPPCRRRYSNRPAAPRTELQSRRHSRPALRALPPCRRRRRHRRCSNRSTAPRAELQSRRHARPALRALPPCRRRRRHRQRCGDRRCPALHHEPARIAVHLPRLGLSPTNAAACHISSSTLVPRYASSKSPEPLLYSMVSANTTGE